MCVRQNHVELRINKNLYPPDKTTIQQLFLQELFKGVLCFVWKMCLH